MTASRSIALVSPYAWPAHDDLTWRIEYEAGALARLGHRVSILTPASGADLLAQGRRQLAALAAGDRSAVVAEPGRVQVVPLGRALPASPRRRIGGPIDLSTALEDVLSAAAFDVVHVHEPLAPSPALAALRHAAGVTAATFHRPEQLAGVAFVQPLLERAMARLDVWAASSDTAQRTVTELFARTCEVIPGGVDITRFHPRHGDRAGPPGLVVIARTPDRVGLRFALRVIRAVDLAHVGPVTILAPRDAPWRTKAAIPKLLRDTIRVVPDASAEARADAFEAGAIALVSSPDELAGSAALEAMACGCALLLPRSPDSDALVSHGQDGLALTPFSRDIWASAISELAADPAMRHQLGHAAASRAAARPWDRVAHELDAAYARAAMTVLPRPAPTERIVADLRVHPGPDLRPRELVEECVARGIGAVGVIGEDGPQAGIEAIGLAKGRITVVAGQHIRTREGALVGLFLHSAIAHGLGLEATVTAVRAQGGVVMAPHPGWTDPPNRDLLRRHHGLVDCFEMLSGPASTARAATTEDAAGLAQRFGVPVAAGSGASDEEALGCAHLRMRPFSSAREFLDALMDAELVQRRRGLRARALRERRNPSRTAT